MIAMANAGFVIGSYAIALGGIALYTRRMLGQARKASTDVPTEERPWT